MFLQACVCPRGGGGSASVHARIPPPRDQADTPWDQADTPPGQADTPRPGRPPGPGRHLPPGPDRPPGKQTPEYGLRAAGTHPTGMHSCLEVNYSQQCTNPKAVHHFWIRYKRLRRRNIFCAILSSQPKIQIVCEVTPENVVYHGCPWRQIRVRFGWSRADYTDKRMTHSKKLTLIRICYRRNVFTYQGNYTFLSVFITS